MQLMLSLCQASLWLYHKLIPTSDSKLTSPPIIIQGVNKHFRIIHLFLWACIQRICYFISLCILRGHKLFGMWWSFFTVGCGVACLFRNSVLLKKKKKKDEAAHKERSQLFKRETFKGRISFKVELFFNILLLVSRHTGKSWWLGWDTLSVSLSTLKHSACPPMIYKSGLFGFSTAMYWYFTVPKIFLYSMDQFILSCYPLP